ncbi:hypothetical protein CERZMDRAFT_95873 [Cercospora zeae-maydis SCOH1-5]|uniref:F-box domain-containing protein n=1 Tax=Cercospora zeae-maydis SCOH1-5 TaxID=717836 RepID=A0A6A6FKE5_9PEZI|nr:hypothetical protein CERZMDRAFT_95873 [Cercospora zeae-maydis SCOH1-5]
MTILLQLPAELLIRITEYSTLNCCKSLSLANARLHKFLEPIVFTCLQVSNHVKDEDSLRAVLHKYGRCVAKLSFVLRLLPGTDDEGSDETDGHSTREEDNAPRQDGLAPLIKDILSGQLCHNVCDINVTILAADNFDGDDWGDDSGNIYMHQDPESQAQVSEQEQSFTWRATMNEAYQALASRTGVKTLRLRAVVPRGCSVFYAPEWQQFLGNIHEFSVELWGGDNGAGWHSNTQPGYADFIQKMNEFFFRHLQTAERVTFTADHQNPIGMEPNFHHPPTPFQPKDMPKLKHLTMENFFIDPALANFIRSHSQQLESLTLTECYGSPDVSAAHPYTWEEFFKSIRDTNPTLTFLHVTNGRAPLTQAEEFHRAEAEDEDAAFQPSEDEAAEIKHVRQRLREDPKLRVWPYVYLDDKYGMVFCDEEENVTAFAAGADQREFEALLRVVEDSKQKKRERGS